MFSLGVLDIQSILISSLQMMSSHKNEYLLLKCTHRSGTMSGKVCRIVSQMMQQLDMPHYFLDLNGVPNTWWGPDLYSKDLRNRTMVEWQEKYFIQTKKWVFVVPEYNGSYPGIWKLLVDLLSIHRRDDTFAFKKCLLIGVATGRAGNLRGMEDMTGVLNYLKTIVYPVKLPLSQVQHLLLERDPLQFKTETQDLLIDLLDRFKKF